MGWCAWHNTRCVRSGNATPHKYVHLNGAIVLKPVLFLLRALPFPYAVLGEAPQTPHYRSATATQMDDCERRYKNREINNVRLSRH